MLSEKFKCCVVFCITCFGIIFQTGCSSVNRLNPDPKQVSYIKIDDIRSEDSDGQIYLTLKFALDMIPPVRCRRTLKLAFVSYDVNNPHDERDYGDLYSKNFDLCSKTNEISYGIPKQLFEDSEERHITAWLWNAQEEKFKKDSTTELHFSETFQLSLKCKDSVCTLLNNGVPVIDPTFKITAQSDWTDVLSPKGWNEEEINAWAQLKIDDFSPYQAAEWKKAGFTSRDTRKYFDIGITAPETARQFIKVCNDKISSPPYYEFPPKSCFTLSAKAIQVIENENSGLYGFDCNRAGECNTVYITFGGNTSKAHVPDIFSGIVKPNGEYTYTTLYGRTKTIPRLMHIK